VKIQKIKLVREPKKTQPRGLAFAGFALDAESVSKALENTEIAYLTVTTILEIMGQGSTGNGKRGLRDVSKTLVN
jgi:hypothetical protein